MFLEGSVAEPARRYGISRKTAYEWIYRFLAGCELADRSRRPRSSPRAVRKEIEDAIVAARKLKPRWGPRKLRAALQRANPSVELPSVGTPLTVTDAFGRYLLACVALSNTRATTVRRALLEIFEQFGLPDAIRSDDGSPWRSRPGRLLRDLEAYASRAELGS